MMTDLPRIHRRALVGGGPRRWLYFGILLLIAQAPFHTLLANPSKATPAKPPPAQVERIEKAYAESILGRPVLDTTGRTIGHIVNLLIDTLGDPQAAIVEFEGFLGVGNRRVAVAWSALKFGLKGDHIVIRVMLDPARLRAMPEYRPNAESVPVAAPPPQPEANPSQSH